MNEKESLRDFLDVLTTSLEEGKGFAIEQAPLVVQELIAWWTVSLTIGLVALAMSTLTAMSAAWVAWRLDQRGGGPAYGAVALALVIVSVISLAMLVAVTADLLKVIYAPRIFVVEYAANLFR